MVSFDDNQLIAQVQTMVPIYVLNFHKIAIEQVSLSHVHYDGKKQRRQYQNKVKPTPNILSDASGRHITI